jgi:hypothetical protein
MISEFFADMPGQKIKTPLIIAISFQPSAFSKLLWIIKDNSFNSWFADS